MTTEELKTVLEEVCGRGFHMNWFQLVVFIVITSIAAFLGAYWKKRGENLATHADIEKLTAKVESVKIDYQKNLEAYKDSLVRKKIVFEKQLEAYNELRKLIYIILPSKKHPEYEWADALEEIALGFSKYENDLKQYLIKYSGVLPQAIRKLIESCRSDCEEGQFEVGGISIEESALKISEVMWKKLISAEKEFSKIVC